MIQSYRETLGKAYPKRDPLAVLAVYQTCAAAPGISQDRICQASGLKPANVSKIIHKGCEMGWILQEGTRTPTGEKPVQLTQKGKKVLADLEELCTTTSNSLSTKKNVTSRAKPRKQHDRPVALNMFEDVESQLAGGASGISDETQGKKAER